MRTLPFLAIALSLPATAQIGGKERTRISVDEARVARAAAIAHARGDTIEERWVVPPAIAFGLGTATLTLRAEGEGECTGSLVACIARFRYTEASAEAALDLAEAAFGAGRMVADEVRIEDEIVGWRLRSFAGNSVDERWILTDHYAPVSSAAPEASFAEGWSRPFVEAASLHPVDVEAFADGLASWSASGEHGRAVRTRYQIERATPADRALVCG